ncbi:rod shape-determining protein [Candidatus Kaiserbacteria bacterium RIFCSPHIGHO2_01_FULL_51_33]|uniref:Cell shape-determining protein MreB n=1 Tax=Candidatus Kaiserbacteria bacterium RIFCSPLOWO2_01_FULL_51_21 TaxID=1798508 RepID=A0A1F6EE04_9BACT|nr:MAG: rod shape-determining protein [Candidatus Kaiserbacteria bacterium RIFCSPHIGHO2_01_FULL_51_33]OGG71884.1 MAG: rod shape-determining protein [Candidatus Kaiserbacteria bacterium RIFCSPLOWO2_01_FULL_51_21]
MFKGFLQKIYGAFSNDIGIDLGTANTLVYLRGRGIVLNEPSVVAVNQKTGRVVAVGAQAKDMLGRTPGHVIAIRPLVDGVISDFEATEEMLAYLLKRAEQGAKKILGPRVVIGIPSGITNVETRAVRDAARNAGAREVHIVEEPMAAAIGIRLPIEEPVGSMVIDIGGGTCDVAIISLKGVVRSKNVRIAGDRLNADIVSYIRSEFKILVGERTAEELKIAVCAVLGGTEPLETTVRGRDLVTGLPREVIITDTDVREAISQSIDNLLDSIKEVLETTPPEMLSDCLERGAFLVGGGALIKGMPELLSEVLKLPVYVADDPLTAVVRGTGIILEHFDEYQDVLIKSDDELSPTQ